MEKNRSLVRSENDNKIIMESERKVEIFLRIDFSEAWEFTILNILTCRKNKH